MPDYEPERPDPEDFLFWDLDNPWDEVPIEEARGDASDEGGWWEE